MKNFYFSLLVAIAALTSMTMSAAAPKWEVVAGMNVANLDATGCSSRIGFHAGARATFGLPNPEQGFYANAAAMLSLQGCKVGGVTFNPYYLSIPVHAGYKFPINEQVAIFGEFGPYFGVGLFGKTQGVNVFDDGGFKRFDLGLGLRAGLEFNQRVPVSIGYDFGVLDVADDISAKTRNLTISIGYKF